jgi:hypothetical protein
MFRHCYSLNILVYGIAVFLFMPVTPFLCTSLFVGNTPHRKKHTVCFHFIMSSRSQPSRKGFAFSPEKDQCTYCGRVVVAGPMGLSRHLARNPDCQLEYSMEHNASRCQQSPTGLLHDTGNRQSDDVFIHTNNGFLNGFNSSLSDDQIARCPREEDFPSMSQSMTILQFHMTILMMSTSLFPMPNVLFPNLSTFLLSNVHPSCLLFQRVSQPNLLPILALMVVQTLQSLTHTSLVPNLSMMVSLFLCSLLRKRFRWTYYKLSRDFVLQ